LSSTFCFCLVPFVSCLWTIAFGPLPSHTCLWTFAFGPLTVALHLMAVCTAPRIPDPWPPRQASRTRSIGSSRLPQNGGERWSNCGKVCPLCSPAA
jgi:hypothetical protein